MFGIFRRSPEVAPNPTEQLKSELESVEERIADLEANMQSFQDVVPADRDLLEQLNAKKQELEEQIENLEHEEKAA